MTMEQSFSAWPVPQGRYNFKDESFSAGPKHNLRSHLLYRYLITMSSPPTATHCSDTENDSDTSSVDIVDVVQDVLNDVRSDFDSAGLTWNGAAGRDDSLDCLDTPTWTHTQC